MRDLKELRTRADRAIDMLSTTLEVRNRQSQDLRDRLTDLKAKYQTRNEELENWQKRIEVLNRENADLTLLAERLIQAVNEISNSEDENAKLGMPELVPDLVVDWLEADDRAVSLPETSSVSGSGDR